MATNEADPVETTGRDKFHLGAEAEDYITEVLENSVWRRAVTVDGKTYWETKDDGLGEVITNGSYKYRHMGSYLLLAPMDPDPEELPGAGRENINKENDARFEAFLDGVADRIWNCVTTNEAEKSGDARPCHLTEERLNRILSRIKALCVNVDIPRFGEAKNRSLLEDNAGPEGIPLSRDLVRAALVLGLNGHLPDIVTDGVMIKDLNGRLDLDFDNYGLEVVKEPQYVDQGLIAWQARDQEPEPRSFMQKRTRAMVDGPDEGEVDDGYESGTSVISQDHSRKSPFYPECESSCWLKGLHTNTGEDSTEVLAASTAPTTTSNVYDELQPGHIRVLILEPGEINDDVFCTLETVDIADPQVKPDFDALSYSWGDPKPTHIIICNDECLGVATNLYNALRHLRLRNSSRKLWIDAICINQKDVEERNSQIQYMYDIYHLAPRVVVWLGLHEADSELAMEAARFLATRDNRQLIVRHDHEAKCLQELEKIIEPLEALLQRPWFQRSWIRQEIAAARRVVVKCGNDQITWTALRRAVNCRWRLREKLLNNASAIEYTPRLSEKEIQDVSTLKYIKRKVIIGQPLGDSIGDMRSLWYYHTGGLLEYMMIGRALDATDPRDKVYSVLGMTGTPVHTAPSTTESMAAMKIDKSSNRPNTSTSTVPTSLGIRIDYAATVSEVYQHVAKYLINTTLALDILVIISAHRSPTGGSLDLPTWCPDWRVTPSEIALNENFEYFHYKFGAAGFTKCLPQDQEDAGRLVVEGFRVDTVTEMIDYGVLTIPHPPEEPVGTFSAPFDPKTHLKRVCCTEKWTGLFPREARIKDEVWILYGCKMPIVLRQVRHQVYVVVGPCYLTTMMWGRELKGFLDRGEQLKKVVLI